MSEDEAASRRADDAARVAASADPSSDGDDEDWERRVADWTAGRRGGSRPEPGATAVVPPSYQPDPAVYEPTSPADDAPRRRRFALKRPGRVAPDEVDAGTGSGAGSEVDAGAGEREAAPAAAASDPAALDGVATWTPDDAAREAAMIVEPSATTEASDGNPAVEDVPADRTGPGSGARTVLPTRLAGLASRLRSRGSDDDDEGPFFPPEPERPVSARPRPRPGHAPAAEAPPADPEPQPERSPDTTPAAGATTATRPRPRPRPTAATPDAPAAPPEPPPAPAVSVAKADTTKTDTAKADTTNTETAADSTETAETAAQDEPRQRRPWRERLRASKGRKRAVKFVILVVVVVAAALALRTYVVAPYYIPSQSMEPTLHGCTGCNDDHVLVDKFSYRFHQPHQGDIVVFAKPAMLQDADSVLIKRVIGVGGDLLVLKNGYVYVNGRRLSEPYINKACPAPVTTPLTGRSRWQIPTDDVFVMGDNRCESEDSRYFGPIPDSSIVGRAFAIVWPLKRLSTL